MGFILFAGFAALLVLGIPIAIALGVASLLAVMKSGVPLTVVPQRVFTSLDSFPIMAIPFFVLAGNLIVAGGISRRLVRLADALFGYLKGGLGYVSVLACAFFAAMSGSGPATVIAIGSMLYPEMVKRGYPKAPTAGLLTVAGGLGPIIPPSIIMVVYGTLTNVSIADLFISGFGVGGMIAIVLMLVVFFVAWRQDWPMEPGSLRAKGLWDAFVQACPGLALPILVLGGIYGGLFTPTEAACISAVYAFFVGVFVLRELRPSDTIRILKDSAVGAASVLFIIATSSIFSWIFAYAGITRQMVQTILDWNLGYYGVLAAIGFTLFVFGFFLEGIATVLLLMPIVFPLAMQVGIDPLHLGMIVVVANVIGQMTPPVAVNIFACSSFTKLTVEDIARGELPFLLALMACYIVVLFVPEATIALPRFLGK